MSSRTTGIIGLAWRAMAPFTMTAEEGAGTPPHVALSPEFAKISGAYVKQRRARGPNRRMLDPALVEQVRAATRLWPGRNYIAHGSAQAAIVPSMSGHLFRLTQIWTLWRRARCPWQP